jgi:hypothetical protein
MKRIWRTALPLLGLLIFALITYRSLFESRQFNKLAGFHDGHGRYLWWSSIRLNSDPLNKQNLSATPDCKENSSGSMGCTVVQPIGIIVDPGWLVRYLVLTAFPAFLLGAGIVRGFSRIGISEIPSFMLSMPVLISGWFYLVGWLLDRWRIKRQLAAK